MPLISTSWLEFGTNSAQVANDTCTCQEVATIKDSLKFEASDADNRRYRRGLRTLRVSQEIPRTKDRARQGEHVKLQMKDT